MNRILAVILVLISLGIVFVYNSREVFIFVTMWFLLILLAIFRPSILGSFMYYPLERREFVSLPEKASRIISWTFLLLSFILILLLDFNFFSVLK